MFLHTRLGSFEVLKHERKKTVFYMNKYYNMKTLILASLMACTALSLQAKDVAFETTDTSRTEATVMDLKPLRPSLELPAVKNVTGTLVGPFGWVSAHFDTRLKGNRGWGFGGGLGWAYAASNDWFGEKDSFHMISLSPEFNYLFGKKSSKFELGGGMTMALILGTVEYSEGGPLGPTGPGYVVPDKSHETFLAYYFFGTIGYRLQPIRGFSMRVGISPTFGLGGDHSVDGFLIIPYLGFGYSF